VHLGADRGQAEGGFDTIMATSDWIKCDGEVPGALIPDFALAFIDSSYDWAVGDFGATRRDAQSQPSQLVHPACSHLLCGTSVLSISGSNVFAGTAGT